MKLKIWRARLEGYESFNFSTTSNKKYILNRIDVTVKLFVLFTIRYELIKSHHHQY